MSSYINKYSIADTWAYSGAKDTNYGTNGLLSMHSTSRRPFIKFDLNGILASQIQSGQLYVYVSTAGASSAGLYLCTSAWTELGVTWNNQPTVGAKIANSATWSTTGWKATTVPLASLQSMANNTLGMAVWANSAVVLNMHSREYTYPPYLRLYVYDIPGVFTLSSPANGAENQISPVTISWTASTGATSYEYRLSTTPGGGTWTSVGNVTSYALSGLSSGSLYYWAVRAVNADGVRESSSGEWHFSVGGGQVIIWS